MATPSGRHWVVLQWSLGYREALEMWICNPLFQRWQVELYAWCKKTGEQNKPFCCVQIRMVGMEGTVENLRPSLYASSKWPHVNDGTRNVLPVWSQQMSFQLGQGRTMLWAPLSSPVEFIARRAWPVWSSLASSVTQPQMFIVIFSEYNNV